MTQHAAGSLPNNYNRLCQCQQLMLDSTLQQQNILFHQFPNAMWRDRTCATHTYRLLEHVTIITVIECYGGTNPGTL